MKLINWLFLCVCFNILAQNKLTNKEGFFEKKEFQNIKWETTKIRKGIRVKTANINLFDSPQQIYILDIDTARAKVNYRVGMPGYMEKTSVQAKEKNAIAAINGSFFNNHSKPLGDSRHLIMIDGKVLAHTYAKEYNTRANGSVTINNNHVGISDWSKEKEEQISQTAENILVSGPLIIDDNKTIELTSFSSNSKRHPRSFIAFVDGHLLLVVVDGRSKNAAGMTLQEVSIFGKALGCNDILNLDGGGSSTLFVKGYDKDEIVNIPSDGSERAVKGIFYITEK